MIEIVEALNPYSQTDMVAQIVSGAQGEILVISDCFVEDSTDYVFSIWIYHQLTETVFINSTPFTFSGWKRCTVYLENCLTYDEISISFAENTVVYVYKAMLVTGNELTDWSPAPEDVDEKFDGYSTIEQMTAAIEVSKDNILAEVSHTYVTNTQMSASISIAKDSILAEVSETYVTDTQMSSAIELSKNGIISTVSESYATQAALESANGKITSLETWKSEASQKITKDGIIATVGNYYTTQSELTASENAVLTDAKEYTNTQVTAVETIATQTADKFNWIVKSGSSSTDFTLTDRVASLLSEEFQIDALTTFKNSASDGSATVIDGGAIKANSIKAVTIDTADLFSQNITATNLHITGDSTFDGVLNGATGSFSGSITADLFSLNGASFEVAQKDIDYISFDPIYKIDESSSRLEDVLTISSRGLYSDSYSYLYVLRATEISTDAAFLKAAYTYDLMATHIRIPTTGSSWINGMELSNAAIEVAIQQTDSAYHSILAVKSSSGHVLNMGGLGDNIGFYGYYASRTANGTDWSTTWNTSTGTLTHSKMLIVQGETVSTSANALRSISGNYGWLLRNDGSDLYFLVTNSGDQWGTFNSLRPFRINNESGIVYVNNIVMQGGDHQVGIRPASDNTVRCGSVAHRFSYICAANGTIQTSDEREKEIIGAIGDDYKQLFMSLEPIKYRWKYGDNKKVRLGLGAQTTERKMKELGITDSDIIQHDYFDEPSNGMTDRYGMDYIAVAMMAVPVLQETVMKVDEHDYDIQQLKDRIDNLQRENTELKQTLYQLQASA